MISVTSTQVIINNPNIVKCFLKYYRNPSFLTCCENLLESYCKSSDEFICQYSQEQKYDLQSNTIMLKLDALEKQNDEFKVSFNTIADDILSKVSGQISSLIISVDNIICASMSKFSTETLKEFITKTFTESNQNSKVQLEEYIKLQITSPMNSIQQKLIEQFSLLPDLVTKHSSTADIQNKLSDMNSKWISTIDSVIRDIKQLENSVGSSIKISADSAHNSPLIIKGVLGDLIHNLEQQTSNISYVVGNIQKDIHSNSTNVAILKSSHDDLKSKIDSLDKQLLAKQTKESNSNSYKGSVAEETLYNLLCDQLMTRNGFTVTKVNGIAHSCDILIERDGYPDIRIESKAHGQNTGEKVRTSQVEKFEKDLLELDNHGIFVSVFSEITGKGVIEITQLPNAKFAIYLGKNMYDTSLINDMVYLLYKLDSIITTSKTNSNVSLSPESLIKIQTIVKSIALKINTVKTSLKDSISVLNSITLEQIEDILKDQFQEEKGAGGTNSTAPVISVENQCKICGFISKTKNGLVAHIRRKCGVNKETLNESSK
jgi:hypothetical protein